MAIQAQQYPENFGGGFSFMGSQDWVETGGRGAGAGGGGGGGGGFDHLYNSVQQEQQQQLQQMMIFQNQQRNQNTNNQNLGFDCGGQFVNTFSNCHLPSSSMAFSQNLVAQVEKQQRHDIDRFIDLQYEKLRVALHEQRKQQLGVLLNSFESKAMSLLKQKEEQLSDMTRKTMELEECLRKTEQENQSWQKIAQHNESMVTVLTNTLEQVRENGYFSSSLSIVEDAGSCCDDSIEEEEDNQNQIFNEEEKRVCRNCKSRDSCYLFLPCRHLCSCKLCDAFLDSCPICKSVKKASIEVYLS